VSLFALLNGDDVHATFDDLEAQYPYTLFAQLYLFTFVIFFITAILNIFIFIIEDSYHAAKDVCSYYSYIIRSNSHLLFVRVVYKRRSRKTFSSTQVFCS